MNVLRKLVVLAPVMLLSLTACEAKLDDAKAQERAATYDAAKVSETYKSYDQKGKCDVKKQTGIFADDNPIMGKIIKAMKDALNNEQKGLAPETGIYTAGAFDELVKSVSTEGAGKATLSYYAYKSSGLKIVAEAKNGKDDNDGMTGGTKVAMYVLDDGRIEKASGSIKLNVSASTAGVSMEGALDMSFSMNYTWNK